MKRFRLGNLLWLVVVAALVIALAVQDRRAARREAGLRASIQRGEMEMVRLTAERDRFQKLMQGATRREAELRSAIQRSEMEMVRLTAERDRFQKQMAATAGEGNR